jgi:transcriptional regulator
MYIPSHFRVDDLDRLVGFMRAYSFAALVSVLDGVPFATHLPLTVKVNDGAVTLTGHMAKQNPHWQAFGPAETLAIFGGPHAYVSPSLYEPGDHVPTWNYVAVHAYGSPRILRLDESGEAVKGVLRELIRANDPAFEAAWEAMDGNYRDNMLKGIVAFEMAVTRLEGKAKLSQNRSRVDQAAVADSFLASGDPGMAYMGEAMRARLAASTPLAEPEGRS